MTEFLLYTGRSGLYLGIFYAFYLLVMRRTTFFRLNRIVLLLGSFACALLPLIRVRTTTLVAAAGALTVTGVGDVTEAGQQGRILLQFTVNADGSMSDIHILRSVSPELDAEALRVVSSCTQKWTPGMQNGKPVPVTYSLPIVFQLK